MQLYIKLIQNENPIYKKSRLDEVILEIFGLSMVRIAGTPIAGIAISQ